MQRNRAGVVLISLVAGVSLAACRGAHETAHHTPPAHVEHVEGQEVSNITLTEKAMERLDIQSAVVRELRMSRGGAMRKVVPYAAVLYDASGRTWVYTRPEANKFVRAPIAIDFIEGDMAVLTDGPPLGTEVVTVGGMELFGAEFEVGH